MKTTLRNRYLSPPRYDRYLKATGYNSNNAKKLYNANIRLAQAFHPILSQFEVVFRNNLNAILANYFQDVDWITHQKNGFMQHHSLKSSFFFLRNSVQKAEDKLRKRSLPVTSGKIISDQTFGFWLSFFLPQHYALVGGQPIHVFPHKPLSENRAAIYDKLNHIKSFRNRVSHCEPLCFTGNNIDCTLATHARTTLYHLINWINPDLVPFFENMDNIQNKINQVLSI